MATTDITVTPEMAEKMKNALMQIGSKRPANPG